MAPSHPNRYETLRGALSHWELPAVKAIDGVHQDHVFRVSTIGPAFTLKDLGTKEPDAARLEFTCEVLEHVSDVGLVVPNPIRTRSGQPWATDADRHYQLYRYIKADPYPDDPGMRSQLFVEVGRAVAQLHEALASYPDPKVIDRTWREDHAAAVDSWVEALRNGLPADQAATVDEVGRARATSIKAAMSRLPEQLIHRDCHPGNVLVQGLRVVGFIDCDHLSVGQPIFDLAYYAANLLKWDVGDPQRVQNWLEEVRRLLHGYRSHLPLTDAETAAFPHALLCYNLLLANWFLHIGQLAPIGTEIRCLQWLHRNFESVKSAASPGRLGA